MATKDLGLCKQEKIIIELLAQGDFCAAQSFSLIRSHYWVESVFHNDNHIGVLRAIYVNRSDLPIWKLANLCHLSERTLFRYRKEIIDCFYAVANRIARINISDELLREVAAADASDLLNDKFLEFNIPKVNENNS